MKMKLPRRTASPTALNVAVVAIFAVAVAGCSSPTAPVADPLVVISPLQLSGALVFFGGESVNGETIQMGQMQGKSTRFQATLTDASGPALGRTVQAQSQRPGGGSGMMGGFNQAPLHLYDDGTHGDPTPETASTATTTPRGSTACTWRTPRLVNITTSSSELATTNSRPTI